MVRGCITAMLRGHKDIILATSYLTKFPDDFPKGILFKREGLIDYRRVKANKLLRWLNKHGYTDVTTETLRVEQIRMTMLEKELLGD